VTIHDAREQLNARLDAIVDHRLRAGAPCPTCGAVRHVQRAPGREGRRDWGEGWSSGEDVA
jgi:hypothetical protein